MEASPEDQARLSRQALEEALSKPPPLPRPYEEEDDDEDDAKGERKGDTRGHNPRAHHHHNHHIRVLPPRAAQEDVEDVGDEDEDEDDEDDEQDERPPVYVRHQEDEPEEEDEEEEEDGDATSSAYPVPRPRGQTPLLGRRPGGTGNGTGNVEDGEEAEEHLYHPEGDYTSTPRGEEERGNSPQEEGETHADITAATCETLEADATSGSCSASTRKQSVADSLATTATVFRSGVDRAPARATTMRSLSLLYAFLLGSLGVVFPLAFFLSGRTRESGMCFAILHIYVTLTSIIFIIYLNVAIWRNKRRERLLAGDAGTDMEEQADGQDDAEGAKLCPTPASHQEENGYLTCSSAGGVGGVAGGGEVPPSPAPRTKRGGGGEGTPGSTLVPPNTPPMMPRARTLETGVYGPLRTPRVGHTEDGVNWFLRLGLIAFGMGSMVLDGFRLVQIAETDVSMQCIGLLFLIFTGLRLMFTFAQTFFLFKNHRVVINFNPLLCRFIMLHLVATNVITWAMTVIMEGSNTYVHYVYYYVTTMPSDGMGDVTQSGVNATVGFTTAPVRDAVLNITTAAATEQTYNAALEWLFEDMPSLQCYQRRSLAGEASSYLFPCVVEYSLLAIAVLCRMYANIGRQLPARDGDIHNDGTKEVGDVRGRKASRGTLECHKANSGLFIGLFVFTLVCIGMLFFLLFENTGVNPISDHLTGPVYYGSDIAVNIFCLIALTPAFAQMRKLHFSGFVREVFNENLMYVSVVGFYLLVGLMIIPALMTITAGGMLALLSELQAISCMLSLIQATVQVVFIFDGLRRRAATRTHFRSKPGRSLITFLLLCNVSLWVIDTFELKEAMTADLFTDFYGALPWILIVHIALPVTIFFRFHSTVCLSDMWVNAYRRPRLAPTRPLSVDRAGPY